MDGVIVGKPFFVPKRLLEWLVRGHSNSQKKYRFPNLKAEIWLRKTSHHWLFRPPLKKNLAIIKKLSRKKDFELYIVSSRYSFLKKRTEQWFKKHKIEKIIKEAYLNFKDEQPHLFKEKIVKNLSLDYFFDDDPIVINHLQKTIEKTKFHLIEKDGQAKIKEFCF